ncbi:hypothetical protein CCMA1212_005127 [Trichoderma ghanense]|uniref:BTB domain-containing protein n=1 Tax=Trichoderma ghanense TaxID=65468 RepID=A0ABY2H380_9HYPO
MMSTRFDGELCDFELVCEGQTISLHKIVICLQSPVIKAACTGSFEEASGRYEMKDCDVASVWRMVSFLYTGDYNPRKPEEIHEIAVHTAMFALADKYLIGGLLARSEAYFSKSVMKENNMDILSQHAKQVYGLQFESSKSLRRILVNSFRERTAQPAARADMQQSLDRLMDEVPEIAKDIALSYIQQPIPTCPCKESKSEEKPPRKTVVKKRRIADTFY